MLTKIEVWKKRGSGPWIVLRLQPSPTNVDAELRLAEILFRPISGREIIYAPVSKDAWKQYNGYRAIVIFFLLAAAKRNESLSPVEELPIVNTSLRPSWINTFSELTQEAKFKKSVWLQRAFGIGTFQKMGSPVQNGLAKIARVKGKTGKAIKIEEKVQRVLNNPDFPKATLFLRTSNLNPKNINILVKDSLGDPTDEGETDPRKLRQLAADLESVESKWWKILGADESAETSIKPKPTAPIPQKPLRHKHAVHADVPKSAQTTLPPTEPKPIPVSKRGRGQRRAHIDLITSLRVAAEHGYAKAQYTLGLRYASGKGVMKDEAEAVKWFSKAAEQGISGAQHKLSVCYASGNGVKLNAGEAARWLGKAAERGHQLAQYKLGVRYALGKGVMKDEAEAAKWLRKAAIQGNVRAQAEIGLRYARGAGVPQHDAEAARWLRKAAERGHQLAQYKLGIFCQEGQGVMQNDIEAAKWFRKAAIRRYVPAQYKLGNCYASGRGVAEDYVQAHKWLNLASAQGNGDAKNELAELEKVMAKEQIAEAQRLAREFKSKPVDKIARHRHRLAATDAPKN